MATTPLSSYDQALDEIATEGLSVFKPKVQDTGRRPSQSAGSVPQNLISLFDNASSKYQVPVNILLGLAEQESGFNPTAVGQPTKWGRAKGLMQYLDTTASNMGINPYDPAQSIDAAAKQIRQRLDKGYSMEDAVKEHFAGPNRNMWGAKTAQYGVDVMRRAQKFLNGIAGGPDAATQQPQEQGNQQDPYPRAQSAMEDMDIQRQKAAAEANQLLQTDLAELNKDEPGRFSVPTEEQMRAYYEKLAQEDKSAKPIDVQAEAQKAEELRQSMQQPTGQGNKDASLLTDTGNLLWSGVNSAAENMQELVRRIPGVGPAIVEGVNRADKWLSGKTSDEIFKETEKGIEKRWSPEMLAARKKEFVTEGKEGYSFGPAWSDPRAYYSGLVESLPETVLTMGMAGRLAKGAYAGMIARGATREEAARRAATVATVAGGLIEGGFGGAASARQVRDEITGMNLEQLKDSEVIKSLMAEGKTFEEARKALAEDSATKAFFIAGVSTGIFGGMGDRALAKIITNPVMGRMKSAAKGAVAEGVFEELPQSATQQMAENYAMQDADPNRPLMKGVANAAAQGGVIGGLMGAGMGAAAPHVAGEEVAAQPAPETATQDAAPAEATTMPQAAPPAPETQAPKPAASGPLGRALEQAIPQQETTDAGANPESVAAVDQQWFGAPGTEQTVSAPGIEPFTATVEGYAPNGDVLLRDLNGESLQVGRDEIAAPEAAPAEKSADPAPAEAANEVVDPKTGEITTRVVEEEAPPRQKSYDEMDEPELRQRLKYLVTQAKQSGWDTRLTAERRKVEAAIDAKTQAAVNEGAPQTEPSAEVDGLTADENRHLQEILKKDSRTQAETAEAQRLNDKQRAAIVARDQPSSANDSTVGEEGLTIVHGSGNPNFTVDDVQIVRSDGQKQGKKGRVYGGFYATSEKDVGQAEGYAGMMGGTPTVYNVNIKPGTKVFQKEGDITRLKADYINDLVSKGYGVVVGTDPRGRTEYAVIDKNAISDITPRSKQGGSVNAETENLRNEQPANSEVSTQPQPDNATPVQRNESGDIVQQPGTAPVADATGAGSTADVLPVPATADSNSALNKDGSVKWFGRRQKAEEFIQKKGLGDTHEIRQVDRRFEIHPKAETTSETTADPASAAPAEPKPVSGRVPGGPRVNRARKLLGAEVGDTIVPQGDVGYAKGGGSYKIDRIEKSGTVHVTNTATGGGTTLSLADIERAHSRKVGFDRRTPQTDAESVAKPETSAAPSQQAAGEWQRFPDDSGTLNIPRAEMPQIKAEHRGAMVNFLNARGIAHREGMVPADTLRPTQTEFSPDRVAKAASREGGERSILVSKDGYVLDGHHQWLAARDNRDNVKAIILDAPIRELLDAAHEFPSSTVDTSSATTKQAEAPEKAADYGANNKLVSQERAAELRQRLKAKFSQLNSGIDPEILAIGTELAVFHIEAGVRKFSAFAKAMAADLDMPLSRLRPYLRSWYNGARDMIEDSGMSIEGMDSPDTVRAEMAKLDQAPVTEEAPAPVAENQEPVKQTPPARTESRQTGALDDMVSQFDSEVNPNVSSPRSSVEQNSSDANAEVSGVQAADVDDGRGNASRPGRASESAQQERSAGQRDQRLSDDGTATGRERSDQRVHQPNGEFGLEGGSARSAERTGSGRDSSTGSDVDRGRAKSIVGDAPKAGTDNLNQRLAAQRKADKAPTKWGDKASIDEALPLLLPAQREDVLKVEQQHEKMPGILITNGTGTGKTASGMGVAKRYANAGKDNILIVVPTDKIAADWVKFGGMMGLKVKQLEGVDDNGGKGPVITTYANMGQNDALAQRDWDLIIPDEAHYLSSNEKGEKTGALEKLRALSGHHTGFHDWMKSRYAKEWKAIEDASELAQKGDKEAKARMDRLQEEWNERAKPLRKQWQERWAKQQDLTKVVFLSATPFAYVKNVDYAEGYLFNYTPPADQFSERSGGGYNSGNAYQSFFMQHFGYRMRYNKLTQPEAGVNSELMEQNFNQWLKDTGALTGRTLDVPHDYDRKFALIDDAAGRKLDEALKYLNEAENGRYRPIYEEVMRTFDYQRRMFLLESMKARAAVPMIKQHLAMGRKVVVFHDYNKGGGFSPFSEALPNIKPEMREEARQLFQQPRFRIDFRGLDSAINTITTAFPDVMLFNGTVSKAQRRKNADLFNDDKSRKNLILVQSDAGREGVSLHDTTGKHQRVLINLGMPVKPVAATQIEGRIYRTGQASDAAFRYLTTGTAWEASAFASKIAERASTAENLALGTEARGLKQSFIDAYNDADVMEASRDDGKGGKEYDRSLSAGRSVSPFQKAKTFYYAQQKNTKRRDQREGVDYFATPEPVGMKMVEWADIKPGDKVLEPSAGHGAIARFFPDQTDVTMVEPSYDLSQRAALSNGTAKIVNSTFEDFHVTNKFDAIVMNPPYGNGGKTAIEHVAKAGRHLREGGRIVALIPRGGMADRRLNQFLEGEESKGLHLVAKINMPSSTFERAGTSVNTQVVVLEKHSKAEDAQGIQQRNIDLSNAENVNELFDRIESLSLPQRLALTADEAIANAVNNARYSVAPATDTPAFKRWFGDSKVVDAEGKPMVVYHGTSGDITAFDPNMRGSNTRDDDAKRGFFFSSSQDVANEYAQESGVTGNNVVPTYLSLKNPLEVDHKGAGYKPEQFDGYIQQAIDEGRDGVIIRNANDDFANKLGGDTFVAFQPEQIKSAIGNQGTFDPNSPDIRYSVSDVRSSIVNGELGGAVENLLDSGQVVIHQQAPEGVPAGTQGWTDEQGVIHLVAAQLNPSNAMSVLLHEAFHAGARPLVGEARWQNLNDRFERFLRAAESRSDLPPSNDWERAYARIMIAEGVGDQMTRERAREELAAYAVENFERMPPGIRKWVQAVIGAVKEFIARRFGKQLGEVTPAQLRAMAKAALRSGNVSSRQGDAYSNAGMTASELATQLREEFDGLKLGLIGSGKTVELSRIVVPDSARNEGTGSQVMQRIVDWADQNGKTVTLSPTGDFGGSKTRLASFYKRFGFIENKGSNKNYEISETMYREPRNTANRYSVSDDSTPSQKDVNSWIGQKWEATKELSDQALKTAMPALLHWTPSRVILTRIGKDIPALKEYADTKLAMDTFRDDWHARTDKIAQRWTKYRSTNRQENTELMALMHETTLAQVDPSEDFAPSVNNADLASLRAGNPQSEAFQQAQAKVEADKVRRRDYDELKARFDKLSPEAQDLYRGVRDIYSALANTQEQIIVDNLQKAMEYRVKEAERDFEDEMQRIRDEGLKGQEATDAADAAKKRLENARKRDAWNRKARITKLRAEFETNRLTGPYFPLSRFGDFFVTARDKATGEVVSFSRMESAREQTRVAKELKAKGYNVEEGVVSKSTELRKQVPPDFVARIEDILKDMPSSKETQDQVWQLYLQTMPDYSLRKNRIHRKGRAGFEEDALRAFASHMFHGAHQTARLKYAMDLGDLLDVARRQTKNTRSPVRSGLVVNQVEKNHQYVMNPTSNRISQIATQGAFMWFLAFSPAAALVNMAQTFIIGVPKLAAFNGGNTARGMAVGLAQTSKALADITRGGFFAEKSAGLNADEKKALDTAYRIGLITRTQSHDVAGIADSGIRYTATRARIMAALSIMFHHGERVNREATFLAAYRMAKRKGFGPELAIDKAAQLTWDTHYDYQNTSRPAVMHSNTGKALLVFRNYTLNMLADLAYNTYSIINPRNAAERKEARTQLLGIGTMLAFNAGIRGLPLYGIAMMIAGMFSDDGEDPETELKKTLLEYMPPSLVGMMMDGVPGYTMGIDLSQRIGFGDLWFRSDDRDREGEEAYNYWLQQVLGASVAIPANWTRGVGQISDGYTWRGIETLVPKMIRDPMKAWRYYSEGATTKLGDPIVDNVNGWDVFKQAVGFTPAAISEQYKLNNVNMNKQKAILEQRSKLLADYYKADVAGDEAKLEKIGKEMDEFSDKYPEMQIDNKTIRRSMKNRERYRDSNTGGMSYNNNLRDRLIEDQPAKIYR